MKLINWIRKEKVDSERKAEELNIMDITERILARKWDNPQFYFPTYADDHVSWQELSNNSWLGIRR